MKIISIVSAYVALCVFTNKTCCVEDCKFFPQYTSVHASRFTVKKLMVTNTRPRKLLDYKSFCVYGNTEDDVIKSLKV